MIEFDYTALLYKNICLQYSWYYINGTIVYFPMPKPFMSYILLFLHSLSLFQSKKILKSHFVLKKIPIFIILIDFISFFFKKNLFLTYFLLFPILTFSYYNQENNISNTHLWFYINILFTYCTYYLRWKHEKMLFCRAIRFHFYASNQLSQIDKLHNYKFLGNRLVNI